MGEDSSNQGKSNGSWSGNYTILCLDRPFQSVATSGRICSEWSGVLRGAPNYRYLLRVEHLRPIALFVNGLETIDAPFRTDETLTHQFWCWYQKRVRSHTSPPLELLFRFQLDLGSEFISAAQHLPAKTPLQRRDRTFALEQAYQKVDTCAAHVANSIAIRMQGFNRERGEQMLVRSPSTDEAWLIVIERSFLTCYTSRQRLSEGSVSGIILD